MGTLYLIGAPLATPEEFTLRALRIVRQVRTVIAADTERARRFLTRLDLHPRLIPVPGPGEGVDQVLAALEQEEIALLQEDWSPGPAKALIQAAVERGFPVVPIPGPVSPVTALVVSGLPAGSFVFLGSLTNRQDLSLPSGAAGRRTLVALEEAAYLSATLARLHAALGDRPLVLEGQFAGWPQGVWRGTLGSALDHLAACPPQGACVLVIGPGEGEPARWDADRLRAEIQARLDRHQSASEIGRQVAAQSGWSRREVYREVLKNRSSQCSD